MDRFPKSFALGWSSITVTIAKGTPDVRESLFGGRGEVRVWSLLNEAAEPFTAVLSCELSPAGSVGPHVQNEYPEIVVGISGVGEARVDGQSHSLAAGDTVFLPLGSVLEIENRATDSTLSYLIIKARG